MPDYLVSIIIPVYKVEQFLPKCIESAINQTYSNIEIILVDDGSPDKCGELCDHYKSSDSRINVIHQSNAGLSAARNAGMSVASGYFVFHLDGDDYIPQNAIEALVIEQKNGDYDLVFGNFETVGAESKELIERDYHDNKSVFLEKIVSNLGFHHYVWGTLIRKKLYDDYKIHPTEGVNVGEDLQVLPQLLFHSNRYSRITAPVYYYNQNNSNSLTGQQSNARLLQDIKSICILEEFLSANGQKKLYERLLQTELSVVIGNIYMRCITGGNSGEYRQLVCYSKHPKFRNAFKELHYSSKIAVRLNNFLLAQFWLSVFNILLIIRTKLR